MSTALKAASVTLQNVLQGSFATDPALAAYFAGGAIVSLGTPHDMEKAGKFGLSLWLYRLIRDEQTLTQPPSRPAPNRIRRQPLPVRLHYLMTPIISGASGGGSPETEQHVLGRVLQTFNDKPRLSGADLSDAFLGTDIALSIRLETLELENIARIWDSLERSYQLCLSYEVGIVPIESTGEDASDTPVRVALLNFGVGQLVGAS
jgi:hypothetical protein